MTQGINELIAAISTGDSEAINSAFNAEMASRISTRLEDMRVSVAQGMFATEQSAEEVQAEPEVEQSVEEVAVEQTEETAAE